MSAADDLGLTEKSRQEYKDRLSYMFAEGCIMFGVKAAAKLFRQQARSMPQPTNGKRPAPPRKRKGPHDPETDKYLVQLWMSGHWKSKHDFARKAVKNHSVKIRKKIAGKVIGQNADQDEMEAKSLIRRLDRALERRSALRHIGRQKTKT